MVTFPRAVPREVIRREGERLGYEGDDLDGVGGFLEIVAAIDDIEMEAEMRRLNNEMAKRNRDAKREGRKPK